MYEKFYGFSERPFSLLPDPDFLFLGEKHRAALDTLELAIFNQSGFCVVSGEIGAGKTTLIRELLNRLGDDIQVGLVSNTHPSFGELMQWVMTAYGLPGDTDDRLELHRRFVDFVIQRYAEGKRTLLIIDEAQNLSIDALEELRMLSNINSGTDLVLQIIMIGQSELRDKLRKPELAQFAQRISVDYFLGGLDCDETCLYIQHRVVHAGGAADLFMMEACQHIYAFSQGIPRVINRLCDLSLVYGYAKHYEQIDAGLVEAVAREQHLGEAMETARQRAAVATGKNVALKTEDDRPEPQQAPEPESAVEPESAAEPEPVVESEPVVEPEPAIELEPAARTESIIEPELTSSNNETPPELSAKPVDDDSVATPAKASEKVVSSDLHTLVVNAEKSRNTRGERSALWLFVVVAVMVGAAAWMSRNEWMPVAGNLAALGEQKKETSAQADEAKREEAGRLAEQRAAEKVKQAQVKREKAQREKAIRLAKQRAAEKAKQAQVKREKAQREKTARLAEQRAAEKAKQAQVKREKAQREEAARLAKQRAAEKAKQAQVKREKAQREKAARLAKQRAAEKAKQAQIRREQVEAKPVIVPATVSRPPVRSRDSVFPAAWANTPEWSEEDDDELLIEEPVVEAAVSQPAEATTATASVSEEENSGSVVEPGGFASNPCNGPTARFLSTCR